MLYAAGRDLRAGHTPLVRALLALGYGARLRTVDWYARHVPAFIVATAVVEGRDDRVTADAEASAPPPSWLLRIELTEERWLEGIEVGARFGTTGDAVGHEDPLEPPHPGVRRHERPRPPSGGAGKWREDTASFRVRPASTAEIRSWSHGEVKKPETINSATFEPEPDGLFCQKVFGPIRDHQCECARQVSDEERGAVCNRCGVRLTDAAVRSRWLGHIELAGPVVHPWFRESASVVLTVLPVLPADLRSMLPVDAAGRFASSDLVDLYRGVINRNLRLRGLLELQAPDVIVDRERAQLADAVARLFGPSSGTPPAPEATERPRRSLAQLLRDTIRSEVADARAVPPCSMEAESDVAHDAGRALQGLLGTAGDDAGEIERRLRQVEDGDDALPNAPRPFPVIIRYLQSLGLCVELVTTES